jgi:hypothetical protein
MLSEVVLSYGFVVFVTVIAVVTNVVVHYEALNLLTRGMRDSDLPPRPRVLLLIFALLVTHVVEIWIFGVAYFVLIGEGAHGTLVASYPMGLLDCVYFSAVCYTTLGLGDIAPIGPIRFLVGTETLTGFLMITWSASFTFVEMERYWRPR